MKLLKKSQENVFDMIFMSLDELGSWIWGMIQYSVLSLKGYFENQHSTVYLERTK